MLYLIKRNSHVTFLFTVVLILSLFLTLKVGDPVEYISVVVESGDSIWDYANEYEDFHDMPNEYFVSWVVSKNELSTTNIIPGEALILPIEMSAIAD